MAKDIILKNQVWEDVPAVDLPIDGGGKQRFTDVSGTTATPSDVANGKVFYDAQGIQRDGTSSGGGANLQSKSKSYTPSETAQSETVSPDSGYDGLSSVAVSVGAIPSNYVGSGITRRDDDDMSGVVDDPYYVVSAPSGYYPSSAEFTLPLMTLPSSASSSYSGTRKANILPSTSQRYLTIPSGYNPTAQFYQLIGAELLPLNITQNGTYDPATYDVFGFGTVTVDVPSGGSSTCATTTMTNSDNQATSIQFTNLSGEPKWFFVRCTSQLTRSSSYSYYYVTDIRYNGTNHNGNYYRRSNGTFYNDTSHYSHTYSNGTLTVSSSASRGAAGGSFYNGTYELVYIY